MPWVDPVVLALACSRRPTVGPGELPASSKAAQLGILQPQDPQAVVSRRQRRKEKRTGDMERWRKEEEKGATEVKEEEQDKEEDCVEIGYHKQ